MEISSKLNLALLRLTHLKVLSVHYCALSLPNKRLHKINKFILRESEARITYETVASIVLITQSILAHSLSTFQLISEVPPLPALFTVYSISASSSAISKWK